jgi:xanthine dehydrogenase molybdopterin-binding subunit B
VVAKTLKIAQKAAKLVKVQYEDLVPVITIDVSNNMLRATGAATDSRTASH